MKFFASETFKQEIKALLIYIVILAIFFFSVDMEVNGLKNDINTVVRVQCLSGDTAAILGKYNDAVMSLIQLEESLKMQAVRNGNPLDVASDAVIEARLRSDLIPIVKPDCSKPLLP